MISKIVIALLLIVVIAIALVFFRSDLNREELSEYINSESEFTDLPMGANVHYRDQGNQLGPVIVLLHGGFGSLHNWEPWIPYLSKDYRIITMDLPAHGLTGRIASDIYDRDSMVQLVSELLAKFKVDQFSIGGNSMGGGVALTYVLKYPQQIESIILIGSEGVPGPDGYDPDGIFLDEDDPALGETVANTSLSFAEKLTTKLSNPLIVKQILKTLVGKQELVTPEFIKHFGTILRHDGNRYGTALMFKQYFSTIEGSRDLEPRLGEIKVPVLLLFGKEDKVVPPKIGEKFHEKLLNSELKLYEGVGHMAMIEVPEQSARDVSNFLHANVVN